MLAGLRGLTFFLQPRTQWQYQPVLNAHDPLPPMALETATHPVTDGISRLVAGAIPGRAYGSFAGKGAPLTSPAIMLSHL